MSQPPVIAESKGNADIDSSVTSRDTFQDVAMEPNMAGPAVSRDTELSDFPFMQLALGESPTCPYIGHTIKANDFVLILTEIWLQVYG